MLPSMSLKVKPTARVDSTGSRSWSRSLVLVSLGTALVLVTYVTPMATIPQTAADLGSGSGARAWMLSSMSVGLAAALLASGAVGDALGRRRTYLVGLIATGVGSVLCAVATGSALFVGARVLEGVGGAAILACGLAILAHGARTPEERSHGSAIWGASVGLGISAGVLLAASLDIGTGWRETYVVVGLLALALVVPSLRLPESAAEHPRRLDLAGVVTLGAAMTLLVSGLTQARSGLTAGVVVLFVAALVLLVLFAVVESRTVEPMLEPALLRNRGFLAATIGTLVLGAGIISMSSNVPTLVQVEMGGSLWAASWLLLIWSVTSVVASLVVRNLRIRLSGPRLIAVALGVVAFGELLGTGMTADSSPWRLAPSMFVAGLATGVLNAVLARESVANVPPDRAAMGSGSNNTARYLGAACGITVFSVLLTHAGWNTAVLVAVGVTLVGAAAAAILGPTKSQA